MEYLGRLLAHQTKTIAPSQLEGISKAPKPETVRHMMTFLGMTRFSSDWIEDYALKIVSLREIMKEAGTTDLQPRLIWNVDASAAFETIKHEMQGASTLATPE